MKKNKKNNNITRLPENKPHIIGKSIEFSGPLPPPIYLEQYDRILPGAAERILAMAEQQSAHRRALEVEVVKSGIVNSRRGLLCGFIIGLVGFLVVTYCASIGAQILAGVVGLADLASLVGVFVYGSQQNKRERTDKQKLNS